jgi:translation elongation factor EF-G
MACLLYQLSGMGELHLEIVKSRLKTAFRLDVSMGDMQVR